MAGDRKCIVCGTRYNYKPCNCKKDETETWRLIYDVEECHQTFEICSSYKNGYLSKGDARIKLRGFDLPTKLNDEYQNIINEINYVEPKSKRKKKELEEEIVNTDLSEE